jgi:hypothetical protein
MLSVLPQCCRRLRQAENSDLRQRSRRWNKLSENASALAKRAKRSKVATGGRSGGKAALVGLRTCPHSLYDRRNKTSEQRGGVGGWKRQNWDGEPDRLNPAEFVLLIAFVGGIVALIWWATPPAISKRLRPSRRRYRANIVTAHVTIRSGMPGAGLMAGIGVRAAGRAYLGGPNDPQGLRR